EIRRWPPNADATGDMKYGCGAGASTGERSGVVQIADDHLGALLREFRQRTSRQHAHGTTRGEQSLGQFAADETGGAGDEDRTHEERFLLRTSAGTSRRSIS